MWFLRVRWDNLSLGPWETPAPTSWLPELLLGIWNSQRVPTPDQGGLLGIVFAAAVAQSSGEESQVPRTPPTTAPTEAFPGKLQGGPQSQFTSLIPKNTLGL